MLTALAVVLVLPLLVTPALASQRVALVIGRASYAHAPSLANPFNDASEIGAALERLGFEVTLLENADYDAMRRGLRTFTRAATTAEIVIVICAGHGIEVDKRNFLIPVDARLLSDREVDSWYQLGLAHYRGRGVARDRGRAFELILRAAHSGDASAEYSVGLLYQRGHGTARDVAKARRWFQRATDKGLKPASTASSCSAPTPA